MKIEFSEENGLLFVDGVAIAAEKLIYLNNVIVYRPQFNCSITINDNVNKTSVTIGKEELDEIDSFILNDNLTLASNENFNFYYNLN